MGVLLVFWILCGVAGYVMLDRFGKGALGFFLGALGGPIGLLIAFFIRDNNKMDQAGRGGGAA
jgi:hypothetical protein